MTMEKPKIMTVQVSSLFNWPVPVIFTRSEELDSGDVPLVSCGDIGNGVIGYFDIPADRQYSHAITVAYNGSWPLTAKFHPYKFGTKDDVAVLIPKTEMSESALLYVAAILNDDDMEVFIWEKVLPEETGAPSVAPTSES